MKEFWVRTNNPGDNITGVNNYKKGFFEQYNYYNFSIAPTTTSTTRLSLWPCGSRYYTDDSGG
jgi:hypothetical protein